jgi:hypothetical protein
MAVKVAPLVFAISKPLVSGAAGGGAQDSSS